MAQSSARAADSYSGPRLARRGSRIAATRCLHRGQSTDTDSRVVPVGVVAVAACPAGDPQRLSFRHGHGGGHRAAALCACQAASMARSARVRYTISATRAAATAVAVTAATASAGTVMTVPATGSGTCTAGQPAQQQQGQDRGGQVRLVHHATSPTGSLPSSPASAAAGCQTVTVLAPAGTQVSAAGAPMLTRAPRDTLADRPSLCRFSHS